MSARNDEIELAGIQLDPSTSVPRQARRFHRGHAPHGSTLAERIAFHTNLNGPIPAHRPEHGNCHLWLGGTNAKGYGLIGWDEDGGRHGGGVHRVAYRLAHGEIPDGWTIDHLCRNRACVRLSHLEAVPHRENVMRGECLAAINAVKTHCLRGHEFTPENTRTDSRGKRVCQECRRVRYRERVKAA